MNAIVSVESDDLFARLAPLLAMKRAPAKFWFLSGATALAPSSGTDDE